VGPVPRRSPLRQAATPRAISSTRMRAREGDKHQQPTNKHREGTTTMHKCINPMHLQGSVFNMEKACLNIVRCGDCRKYILVAWSTIDHIACPISDTQGGGATTTTIKGDAARRLAKQHGFLGLLELAPLRRTTDTHAFVVPL